MTRDQAIALRTRQLNGYPVPPLLLLDAIEVLKQRPPKAKPGRKTPGTSKRAINRAKRRLAELGATDGERVI